MFKENLIINSEICDARKIKEENYESYKKIIINSEILITSERSREILNSLGAIVNSDAIIDAAEDEVIDSRIVNGNEVISKDPVPKNKVALLVNGNLEIETGSEEVLDKYQHIFVNGSVLCPRNMKEYVNKMTVNGNVNLYPENANILDPEFVMDKYFPLRIKANEKYYVAKQLIIKDEVDEKALEKKQPVFETPVVFFSEEKVETLAPLFDIKTRLEVVPKGMNIIPGDIELNDTILDKLGQSLYIVGDLDIDPEFSRINDIKKLIVNGTLNVKKATYEKMSDVDIKAEDIHFIFEGKSIMNVPKAKIDRRVLEENEHGVRIMNCAILNIDEDVDTSLLADRLSIMNCAKVLCSEEQKSTVALISTNVARIGNENESEGSAGLLGTGIDLIKAALNSRIVNSEKHIM